MFATSVEFDLFDIDDEYIPANHRVNGILEVPFDDGAPSTPTLVGIGGEDTRSSRDYDVFAYTVSGEELVVSSVGDRWVNVAPGHLRVRWEPPCSAQPTVTVTLEVLLARGSIDTRAYTIDKNFWRRLAIDVTGDNPGCGVGAVHGKAIFDLYADAFVSFCSREPFQFVGDAEPPPPGVEDAGLDAGAGDASVEDMAE